jgi:hypothetical protein
VVNLSPDRTNAFIINWKEIRSIRLENLTEDKAKKMTGRMPKHKVPELLKWLWGGLASPVLTALGFHRPLSKNGGGPGECSRIWRMPTGMLIVVLLHAAGIHYPKSKDTLLNRAMPSYSASCTAADPRGIMTGTIRGAPEHTTACHSTQWYVDRHKSKNFRKSKLARSRVAHVCIRL